MGTVALPTYEAQGVEKQAGAPRQDYSGLARLGQAQENTFNMIVGAATGIGKSVIDKARADEYNAYVSEYNAEMTKRLTDAELNPINPQDPRYAELESDDEKALPNLALYKKDREAFLEELTKDSKFPQVKEAFTKWAADRWTAEQDGLTRFDVAKIREVTYDNYMEEELAAIESGNFTHAKDLADVALAADIITPKMYDDHLDLAAKDITKRNATLKALSMGGDGLAWVSNSENVKYQTYDGKVKAMPLAEHEAMITDLKNEMTRLDGEKNKVYENGYAMIASSADARKMMGQLQKDSFYTPDMKYSWTQRLKSEEKWWLSFEATPDVGKTSVDDYYKANYDVLVGKLATFASRNPNDVQGLQDIITNAFSENDPSKRRISGAMAATLLEKYQHEDTNEYKLALGKMTAAVSKMPQDDQFTYVAQFEKWYRDPSRKMAPNFAEVESAIKNIMDGYLTKVVDAAFPGNVAGAAVGRYTGVSTDKENLAALESQVPKAITYANKQWAQEGIVHGVIDTKNEYGFGEGAAILLNGNNQAYAFKMDGKELKLYQYVQTDPTGEARKGTGPAKGPYVWQEVVKTKPGQESAKEVELRSAAAAEAVSAEQSKKTPDRSLTTYGVEHDATGGWYIAGEKFGSRKYFPAARQAEYDNIWKAQQ